MIHGSPSRPTEFQPSRIVLSLVLNSAAAIVAVAAALAAARRRREARSRPFVETQLLCRPSATADRGRVRQAA